MGANAHCASRRKEKGKARSSCSIPEQKPGEPQRHGRQNGLWAKKMMSPFPALWNLCSATSAATQEFRGKFEAADSITGEVEFSPLVGERPSKRGTFKATRSN